MFYACQLLVEDSLDREARLTLGYSPASRVAVRERHGDLDKIWENSTTAQQHNSENRSLTKPQSGERIEMTNKRVYYYGYVSEITGAPDWYYLRAS